MDRRCARIDPRTWALAALARLPLGILHPGASVIAFLAHRVVRYRRAVVEANLRSAFPGLERAAIDGLVRAFYRNLADVLLETVKAYAMPASALHARVRIVNPELLDRYVRANQSIVLLGSHEANWEWVFLACCSRLPFAVDAVYKPLHDPVVDRFMLAVRSRFGANLITPAQTFRGLVDGRHRLRAVAILADQRPASERDTHRVHFLGRETPFPVGFEMLARMWKYPVVLANRRRVARGRYEVVFEVLAEPPYGPQPNMLVERYVAALERSVRAHPADWLWSHRRWRSAAPLRGVTAQAVDPEVPSRR